MSGDLWRHSLSFVLRFNNHFTGEAVGHELAVRLDGSFARPVENSGGTGIRQTDGTYRFVDIPGGAAQRVRWRPPLTRTYRNWVSWEPDLEVTLPTAEPAAVIERDLWPTPGAPVAPGFTAIRGKLLGLNIDHLEVRLAPPATSTPHFTLSDDVGEFLFLLPDPTAPDNQGLVDLELKVAGGTRVVNGGEFRPLGAGAAFPAAEFKAHTGRCERILFRITLPPHGPPR